MKKTFKCCVVMVLLGVVGSFSVEAGITDKLRKATKDAIGGGDSVGGGGMYNKGKNDEKEKEKDENDEDKDEDEDDADIRGKKDKNADRWKGDIVSSTTDDEGNITTVTQTDDGNYITQVTDEDGNLVSTEVKTYSDNMTQVVTVDEATGKVTVEHFVGGGGTLTSTSDSGDFGDQGSPIATSTYDRGELDDQGNLIAWVKNDENGRPIETEENYPEGSYETSDIDPDTGNTDSTLYDRDGNVVSTTTTEGLPGGGEKETTTGFQTGEVTQTLYDDDGYKVYSDTKNSDGVEVDSFERAPDGSTVSTQTDLNGNPQTETRDKDGHLVFRESTNGDGTISSESRDSDTGNINITNRDMDNNVVSTTNMENLPGGGFKKTDTDHRTGEVTQTLYADEIGVVKRTELYRDKRNSDGDVISSFETAADGSHMSTWTDPDGIQWTSTSDKDYNDIFKESTDGDGNVISSFEKTPDGSTVETGTDPDGTQWSVTRDKDGNIVKRETNDPNDSLGKDDDELK